MVYGSHVGSRTGAPHGPTFRPCTFPAPATSHVACGFPALRAPICFMPRLIGSIVPGNFLLKKISAGDCQLKKNGSSTCNINRFTLRLSGGGFMKIPDAAPFQLQFIPDGELDIWPRLLPASDRADVSTNIEELLQGRNRELFPELPNKTAVKRFSL